MEDWLQWAIAAACFAITVALQAQVAILFVAAGLIGLGYYGTVLSKVPPAPGATLLALPLVPAITAPPAAPELFGKLLVFFLKAGSLTFGSGLVSRNRCPCRGDGALRRNASTERPLDACVWVCGLRPR